VRTSEPFILGNVEDVDDKLDGDAGVEYVPDDLGRSHGVVDERTAIIQIPHLIIIISKRGELVLSTGALLIAEDEYFLLIIE
jgi:hypothetical protein